MLRIAEIDVADDVHDAAVRLLRQALILAAVRSPGQGVQQLRDEVVNVDQLQFCRRCV